MVKTSIKVRINSRHIKTDGTSAIYLQVIINRKKYDANINLSWPAERFDINQHYCLKRHNNDKDCDDYNMIIRDAVQKANEIVKYHRLSGSELTMDKFKEEFNNENLKKDFIKFFEHKMKYRYNKRLICKRTYNSHNSTLLRLKDFVRELKFSDIRTDFPNLFDSYLRDEHNNNANTIHGRQKTIKSYMKMAENENIFFTNPYHKYKLQKMKGNWKSLTRKQLKNLNEYYQKLEKSTPKKAVLRRFLFSCFTGLRLSDMKNLSKSHITDEYLVINVFKTRKMNKILHLPLSNNAKKLLIEEKEIGDLKQIFNRTSDQYSNRVLTEIGKELGFNVKLHHHIGRETFATLYLESGGKIEVLKEYLDHSDIQTTMKYVHITEERKLNEINMIDKFV